MCATGAFLSAVDNAHQPAAPLAPEPSPPTDFDSKQTLTPRREDSQYDLHISAVANDLKLMAFFRKGIAKLATEAISKRRTPFITFVLGGPGSGKGTQCQKIAEVFNFEHICAGDLLREEMSSNSQIGAMIRSIIMEGMIVPSEITVNLLKKEIHSSGNIKVLIDGFPRNEENRMAFERIVGIEPDLVLFFDCPEQEIVERILKRNQGRIDDNIDTIKKRLESFKKLSLPVIDHYTAKGKVYKINAVGSVDEVFQRIRPVFTSLSSNSTDGWIQTKETDKLS